MLEVRRRKKLVDIPVQGALVKRIVMHWCAFVLVGCAAGICLQVCSRPFRSLPVHIEAFWANQVPFVIVLIALLPLFVWDTIKISNRFAGPVFRLRKAIQSASEGQKPAPLRFRDDDFWQELAVDFNQMIDRFSPPADLADPTDLADNPSPYAEIQSSEQVGCGSAS